MTMTTQTLRFATRRDARRLALMHIQRIDEGFLASLGPRFLTHLYRRVARSRRAFAIVLEHDGEVVAFCAVAENVRTLYLEFVARNGVIAALTSAPRLVRALPRVLETLRYPSTTDALPAAEILSVVTTAEAAGRGNGSTVLFAALRELDRRGIGEAKVVAGAANASALRLYERAGFRARRTISIHDGVPSEVLVWASS